MKTAWLSVILILRITLASSVLGQGTLNLTVRLHDSIAPSNSLLAKELSGSRLEIKYSDLQPQIERFITLFEDSGYPFVKITLDSVKTGLSSLNAVLWIDPGELVRIDTVINRSGYRISQPVLQRLVNIKPGDLYREKTVREAGSRLASLNYLKQIRPPDVGFYPGKASVYLYPEKAGANRFDGWVGLSPDLKSAGKVTFSGALALDLLNVLGQGEDWQFNWRRNPDGSQRLNISAHAPYLIGLPLGVLGRFDLFRQDTSYLNLEWEAGIPYHLSPRNQLTIFIRHQESSLLNSSKENLMTNRSPFSSTLSGISWNLDRLDNPINPYKGLLVNAEASTGRKSVPDSAAVNESEFRASVAWYKPLSKNLTGVLRFQSGYRIAPEVYENEQYRLGGINLLRGFNEDSYYTDAYLVNTIEVRYLLDKSSNLLVLADLGLLRGYENAVPVLKTPAGFGVGGQIRTAGGIFRILFAIGKESGIPLNLRNSKIHLGYVGLF